MAADGGFLGFSGGGGGGGGAATTLTTLAALFGGENAVTAFATGGQTNATALDATVWDHRVSTVATVADSVKLPAATVGQRHYLRNDGAAAMQVFGQATETINGVASATGVAQAVKTGVWYVCTTAGQWTTTLADFASFPIGSLAAVNIRGSGVANTGWYWTGSAWAYADTGNLMYYADGTAFYIYKANAPLTLSGASNGSVDVKLLADAAQTLAQRNGTNAQTFNVYNTYTSGAVYERAFLRWNANVLEIGNENTGASNRSMRIMTPGTTAIVFQTNGSDRWLIASTGHILAQTDNTLDIGATGANRPRSLYLAAAIKQIGNVTTSGAFGAPTVVATGRVTAQSAANASISTFTVGAADGSFEVSANMNVTASTTLVTTLTVTYTDEASVARTMILPIVSLNGTWVAAGAITGAGASVWHTPTMHIRCKAATAITILTSAGTFTGVTYTAEGIIKQTA